MSAGGQIAPGQAAPQGPQPGVAYTNGVAANGQQLAPWGGMGQHLQHQNQVQNPQQFQNMLQMQRGLQTSQAQPLAAQGAYSPAMAYATAPQNQMNTTAGLLGGRPV